MCSLWKNLEITDKKEEITTKLNMCILVRTSVCYISRSLSLYAYANKHIQSRTKVKCTVFVST